MLRKLFTTVILTLGYIIFIPLLGWLIIPYLGYCLARQRGVPVG